MARVIRLSIVVVGLVAACSPTQPVVTSPITTAATPVTTAAATTLPPVISTTTLLPVVSTTSIVPSGGRDVEVPAGESESGVVVDGTIDANEWAGAVVEVMNDGTEVRFLQNDGYVYVAIAGAEVGAVNVLLAAGDVVRVLHSSAALGSALYERDGDAWVLVSDFDWCCRSGTDDTARTELLTREGWQASIGYAGEAGHVEYQVLMEDGSFVAISSVRRDGTAAVWPADLGEEARRPLYGAREELESFDFSGWAAFRSRLDG